MPTMSDIKIGDIVTPTAADLPTVQKWAGPSQGNQYRVTNLSEQFSEIFVQPIPAIPGRRPEAFMVTRFKTVVARVEGNEIRPQDIKVGDEILVTRKTMGLSHMRQAVVKEIKTHNDRYGTTLSFQTEHRQKINWGQDHAESEVFTLIKAAPDKDLVLEGLVQAGTGQVITFGTYLARRNANTSWTILDGVDTTVESAFRLRGLIGEAEVKWMKPEVK